MHESVHLAKINCSALIYTMQELCQARLINNRQYVWLEKNTIKKDRVGGNNYQELFTQCIGTDNPYMHR